MRLALRVFVARDQRLAMGGRAVALTISAPLALSPRRSTCSEIDERRVEGAGMYSGAYGTHSMRRTKAAQIYRKTGNLRAVQLLLEMAT